MLKTIKRAIPSAIKRGIKGKNQSDKKNRVETKRPQNSNLLLTEVTIRSGKIFLTVEGYQSIKISRLGILVSKEDKIYDLDFKIKGNQIILEQSFLLRVAQVGKHVFRIFYEGDGKAHTMQLMGKYQKIKYPITSDNVLFDQFDLSFYSNVNQNLTLEVKNNPLFLSRDFVSSIKEQSDTKSDVIPTLSIVVPIYNVERYLFETLKSLLEQGLALHQYEVLMVNDQSTDDSGKMAQFFEKAFSNFYYIEHDKNKGLGAGRNTGAKHARGKWLYFIDSDDFLKPGFLGSIWQEIIESTDDYISFGVERYDEKTGDVYKARYAEVIWAHTRRNITLKDYPYLIWDTGAWNKIINRKFYETEGIAFPEANILYEDLETITDLQERAKSITVLAEYGYMWRVRAGEKSISQTLDNFTTVYDRLNVTKQLLKNVRTQTVLESVLVKVYLLDFTLLLRKNVGNPGNILLIKSYLEEVMKTYDRIEIWRQLPLNIVDLFERVLDYEDYNDGLYTLIPDSLKTKVNTNDKRFVYFTETLELDEDMVYLDVLKWAENPDHELSLEKLKNLVSNPLKTYIFEITETAYADIIDTYPILKTQVNITTVAHNSQFSVMLLAKSGKVVTNGELPIYFYKREEQIVELYKDSSIGQLFNIYLDKALPQIRKSKSHDEKIQVKKILLTIINCIDKFQVWRKLPINIIDLFEKVLSYQKDGDRLYAYIPENLNRDINTNDKRFKFFYNEVSELDNVVLYDCFYGSNVNGNPGVVLEKLLELDKNQTLMHIFVIKENIFRDVWKENKILRKYPNVKIVAYNSQAYVKLLATAKYLVVNTSLPHWFIKNDNQKIIQTWHGIPLKKLGSQESENFYGYKNVTQSLLKSDYLLVQNEFTRNQLIDGYQLDLLEKLRVGYISWENEKYQLYQQDSRKTSDKLRVIYAPTWRYDKDEEYRLYDDVLSELHGFEEVEINFKGHLNAQDTVQKLSKVYTNINYITDDIETVIGDFDVIITDYSSVYFSAIPYKKPIILLQNDKNYLETQGIHEDINNLFKDFILTNLVDLEEKITQYRIDTVVDYEVNYPEIWSKLFATTTTADNYIKEIFELETFDVTNFDVINNQTAYTIVVLPKLTYGNQKEISDILIKYQQSKQEVIILLDGNYTKSDVSLLKLLQDFNILNRSGALSLSYDETTFYNKDFIVKSYERMPKNAQSVFERIYHNEIKRVLPNIKIKSVDNYSDILVFKGEVSL